MDALLARLDEIRSQGKRAVPFLQSKGYTNRRVRNVILDKQRRRTRDGRGADRTEERGGPADGAP